MLKKTIIISLFLLFISPLSLIAQTATDEFHKTISFKSGGKVSVRNINGYINAESWDKDQVKIDAEIRVKTEWGSSVDAEEIIKKVKIEIDESGDMLRIEADYPNKKHGVSDWNFNDDERYTVIVDYSIKIPVETDLNLDSVNGAVKAENLKGEISLKTVNGSVNVSDINGSIKASTVNGEIKARSTHLDKSNDIHLSSVNGSVRLSLPSNVAADIHASTVNGGISTDFPVTVTGKFIGKKIDGKINGGGSSIDLSTVNGGISIDAD